MVEGRHVGVLDRPRFGEHSKLVPVFFVICTIFVLYTQYVVVHGFRLLQLDYPPQSRDDNDVARGIAELSVFHVMSGFLLYCFARCILTHPGTIPDGDGWDVQVAGDEGTAKGDASLIETKRTGERRHCKWCLKYKPDRCHHCRVCNMCVLRMDHHCPWVYNCIGFRNHKYFFLVLVYGAIDLGIIVFSMFETVWWSTRTDVALALMIILVVGEAFATFLMVIVWSFLCFHLWLMTKAMTTVEFCEKSLKKASYDSSIYSRGCYTNFCAVLGPNPLLWLLPISLPVGDGINWQSDGAAEPEEVVRRPSRQGQQGMPTGSTGGRQRRVERERAAVLRKAPGAEPAPAFGGTGGAAAATTTPSTPTQSLALSDVSLHPGATAEHIWERTGGGSLLLTPQDGSAAPLLGGGPAGAAAG